MTRNESINNHRKARNINEERTQQWLRQWLEIYRPNKEFAVEVNEDEWGKIDVKVDGHLVELKSRWLTKEMVDNYKKGDGFVVSTSKSDDDERGAGFDALFYFLNATNEVLTISGKKVKALVRENKIKTSTRSVNRYQFAPELGKKEETMYFIPYKYFHTYNMNLV